jgi:hypothetical protein
MKISIAVGVGILLVALVAGCGGREEAQGQAASIPKSKPDQIVRPDTPPTTIEFAGSAKAYIAEVKEKSVAKTGTELIRLGNISVSLAKVERDEGAAHLTIVVTGLDKSEIAGGESEPGLPGKYESEAGATDYLELNADGSFYQEEGGTGYSGQWKANGDEIILTLPSGVASKGRVEGDTLIDRDGVRWAKQSKDKLPAGLTISLKDDKGNAYRGELQFDAGQLEIYKVLPPGLALVAGTANVAIPKAAPIAEITVGGIDVETESTAVKYPAIKLTKLNYRLASGGAILSYGDTVQAGLLTFKVGEGPIPTRLRPVAPYRISLPITAHNTDYNPRQGSVAVHLVSALGPPSSVGSYTSAASDTPPLSEFDGETVHILFKLSAESNYSINANLAYVGVDRELPDLEAALLVFRDRSSGAILVRLLPLGAKRWELPPIFVGEGTGDPKTIKNMGRAWTKDIGYPTGLVREIPGTPDARDWVYQEFDDGAIVSIEGVPAQTVTAGVLQDFLNKGGTAQGFLWEGRIYPWAWLQGPPGPPGPAGQRGLQGPAGPRRELSTDEVKDWINGMMINRPLGQRRAPDGASGLLGDMGAQGQGGPAWSATELKRLIRKVLEEGLALPPELPKLPGPNGERGPVGLPGAQGQQGPPRPQVAEEVLNGLVLEVLSSRDSTGLCWARAGYQGPQGPAGPAGPWGPKADERAVKALVRSVLGELSPDQFGPPGAVGPVGQAGPIGPKGALGLPSSLTSRERRVVEKALGGVSDRESVGTYSVEKQVSFKDSMPGGSVDMIFTLHSLEIIDGQVRVNTSIRTGTGIRMRFGGLDDLHRLIDEFGATYHAKSVGGDYADFAGNLLGNNRTYKGSVTFDGRPKLHARAFTYGWNPLAPRGRRLEVDFTIPPSNPASSAKVVAAAPPECPTGASGRVGPAGPMGPPGYPGSPGPLPSSDELAGLIEEVLATIGTLEPKKADRPASATSAAPAKKGQSIPVTFKWNPVPGVEWYEFNLGGSESVYTDSNKITVKLIIGENYYWDVAAWLGGERLGNGSLLQQITIAPERRL